MYLRGLAEFGLDEAARQQREVRFAEVAEVARARGETALGYVTATGAVHTAPASSSARVYKAGDQLIVLAQVDSS